MLTGRDIIVFSDDWGRHPFSCQHIMSQFLPGNRILWVNTIGMRRPRLNLYDLTRGVQKIASFCRRQEGAELPENLSIISPVMIPYGNSLAQAFNRRSVVGAVRSEMAARGFSRPIVVTTLPIAADYLGSFAEELAVFYCVDEFLEWPGVNKTLVCRKERELLAKVDLVVAVSDALQASKRPANQSPVRLLTHGVELGHFARARTKTGAREVQTAFAGIHGPVIGYFGLFDDRTDQNILEAIAKAHPEWSLVIIGKTATETGRLGRYGNIRFLGPVPYDALPDYVSLFSVCILPYVRSILTDNINPLKLKEYLATGKPVVSTPLPEAEKLRPWLGIAAEPEDFVLRIEEALLEPPDSRHRLDEFLAGETWPAKAELLSAWIAEALSARGRT